MIQVFAFSVHDENDTGFPARAKRGKFLYRGKTSVNGVAAPQPSGPALPCENWREPNLLVRGHSTCLAENTTIISNGGNAGKMAWYRCYGLVTCGVKMCLAGHLCMKGGPGRVCLSQINGRNREGQVTRDSAVAREVLVQ